MNIKKLLKKNKILFIVFLVLLEIGLLFLMYKSSNNNILNQVSLKDIRDNDMFVIMIEQNDGTYIESTSNAFSYSNYIYNARKSGCMDHNGEIIDNSLSYNSSTKTASVNIKQTSYCYLYFDIPANDLYNLCKEYSNLEECMSYEYDAGGVKRITNINGIELGDMYRYRGASTTVNNNYICFGTSNKAECLNNTNKYLYRIIGIRSDGRLKLIKKEPLTSLYQWHNDCEISSVTWATSDIFTKLNGTDFLDNEVYIAQTWKDKISLENWKYGNFSPGSSSGTSANWVYGQEERFTDKVEAKIGLLYIHDYYFQSKSLECHLNGDYEACKNGWLAIGNNATNLTETLEWTMVKKGCETSGSNGKTYCYANTIQTKGTTSYTNFERELPIRPVFYLENNSTISGGLGTIDNPYIIES